MALRAGSPDEVKTMASAVGAFPLKDGSDDAALLLTLKPSDYSFQISGVGGGLGVVLIEVYDVSEVPR